MTKEELEMEKYYQMIENRLYREIYNVGEEEYLRMKYG